MPRTKSVSKLSRNDQSSLISSMMRTSCSEPLEQFSNTKAVRFWSLRKPIRGLMFSCRRLCAEMSKSIAFVRSSMELPDGLRISFSCTKSPWYLALHSSMPTLFDLTMLPVFELLLLALFVVDAALMPGKPRFLSEPIEPFSRSGFSTAPTSGPPNSCNCWSQQQSIASMPSSTRRESMGKTKSDEASTTRFGPFERRRRRK